MNKEFIPYEQALALNELGFDDEVLKVYDIDSSESELFNYGEVLTGDDELYAPLYQQAFRWFREKYNLYISIHADTDNGEVEGLYYSITEEGWLNCYESLENDLLYKTYEEAELECLKKLIEIVKETL